MRWLLGAGLVLVLCLPVSAGELVFVNGSRLAGELSNEGLMLSTGSGLVEIASDEVVTLSRDEIRLRDGRVIRGTLVGGQIKAKTTLGEIAVKVDERPSPWPYGIYDSFAPKISEIEPIGGNNTRKS